MLWFCLDFNNFAYYRQRSPSVIFLISSLLSAISILYVQSRRIKINQDYLKKCFWIYYIIWIQDRQPNFITQFVCLIYSNVTVIFYLYPSVVCRCFGFVWRSHLSPEGNVANSSGITLCRKGGVAKPNFQLLPKPNQCNGFDLFYL